MGIKSFIASIKEAIQSANKTVDPAVFNHPLALKTSWAPKAGGGANFKTRTLKKESNSILYYKGSKASFVFGLVFAIFPLLFLIPALAMSNANIDSAFSYLFFIIPVVFMCIGIALIISGRKRTYIDKTAGYLYKSRRKAIHGLQTTPKNGWVKLDQIKALQIIQERISSKNGSYHSYEINAVFPDGERLNIIDHGKYKSIIADAQMIADFLRVPCWNGLDGTTYTPPQSQSAYDQQGNYDDKFNVAQEVDIIEQDLDEEYDSLRPRKM